MSARLAAALALALATGLGAAEDPAQDVFYLKNGDRISGRTVLKGKKTFGLATRFGRLNLPRDSVVRIRWSNGKEELIAAPGSLPAQPPPLTLVVAITGRSFWQAWDPQNAPADPSLRLELTLDEEPLASYVDGSTDAEDLPGATVNSFHFAPSDVVVRSPAGIRAEPPETRPGRITLRLRLPAALSGERRLRLAYQTNEGTPAAPAWRDLVESALSVTLKAQAPVVVGLAQDPGQMDYSRKRMKAVETFRLEAHTLEEKAGAELDTSRPEP
jgi:hypothetical protein